MKLLAIDGNSFLHRAFHGIRPLSTQNGFPTHAILGFLNIMHRLQQELSADALCVTFDCREKTFRHTAYPDYKATRKPMDDALAVQIPKLKEILDAMNIPRFELPTWEGDDLLGTIARSCEENGWHCIIATGDKDAFQLISDTTFVHYPSKQSYLELDRATFREMYGFEPHAMVDFKALMGDSSDNIPGVAKVGEKTAKQLLQSFGTLENIYANLDSPDMKPAVKKHLVAGTESARISYELATIQRNAPIDFHPEDCLCKPINQAALYSLFSELEFYKFIEQWGLHALQGTEHKTESQTVTGTHREILDPDEALRLAERWKTADPLYCLTLPDLLGFATCQGDEVCIFLQESLPNYDYVLDYLFSEQVKKCTHGVKQVQSQALALGYGTEGFVFDTELAAYLLAPTDGSYTIAQVIQAHCHSTTPEGKKTYLKANAFAKADKRKEALTVFAQHCAYLPLLLPRLGDNLDAFSLRSVLEEMELPLCAVLANMERVGIFVDKKALRHFGERLQARIAKLEESIYTLAGEQFNINSTQQLGVILFEKLHLPPVKKTKTGYSTNIEVLEKLQDTHPIISHLISYRQLAKLNSTYVIGMEKVIAPDGRIHTSFQNTVTATGRLSSTEPNLQNIPVRTPLGAQMRQMFVAEGERVLVDADYSQIELRLLAHIAQDDAMIDAFASGTDIHTSTAAQVFAVPLDAVTPDMRRHAKAVNFGIVYGISDFSLSQDIGVTRREAGEYIARYFARFSGVRRYMDTIVAQAQADGYVKTLFGRRRWLPELASSNYNLRSFGERVALNMPIQGTAADIMKLAMIRVYDSLKREIPDAKLMLQVHDELLVECAPADAPAVQALLSREMQEAVSLSVPLLAEAGVGKTWASAKA